MALFCCTPLVPVQRGHSSLVESLRPLDIFLQTHTRPTENQNCISIQWLAPSYTDARRKESNTTVLIKHIITALIPLLRYSQPLSAVGEKKNSVFSYRLLAFVMTTPKTWVLSIRIVNKSAWSSSSEVLLRVFSDKINFRVFWVNIHFGIQRSRRHCC